MLMLLALTVLVACGEKETPLDIDYDSNVTVNMSINYTSGGKLMSITNQTGSTFISDVDGETYAEGDLLPTWAAIGEKLNVSFVDKATASDSNTNAQFTRLQTESFAGVDVVNATGSLIGPEGVKGNFVNLADYLDYMPNFGAFLEANPAVQASITAADGGIYFTPYFDGFGEAEQMFLMRIDWVEDILDAADTSAFDTAVGVIPDNYTERVIPDGINVDIESVNEAGVVRTVHKEYSDNILDTLAALGSSATGKQIADAFRAHVQNAYGDQGYAKLSDVFVGSDAVYDTDELLALMYVVKSNPQYLTREFDTPLDSVEVYFPREGKGSRIRNLFRGLEMFGVRGAFSRAEWLYFDQDGNLNDARHDQSTIDAINNLSDIYNDGLIVQDPEGSTNWRSVLLNGSSGFMSYDYNASSTATGLIAAGSSLDPTYSYQAVLPPVVDWLGDGNYFHFTEAVRSVKNEAWGIPVGVEDDETKLYRVIKLFDEMYDYSAADSVGTIGLYGPSDWTDGTLAYGSDTVYKLSAAALAEMEDKGGGNMINYLRQYVGATLPIGHIRSLGLEFQTLSDDGVEGIDRINRAVEAGTFLLAGQVDSDNPWYNLSPTFFPLTAAETLMIQATTEGFTSIFADDALITMVKYGFSGNGGSISEEDYWALFQNGGVDVYNDIYIAYYRLAYDRLG